MEEDDIAVGEEQEEDDGDDTVDDSNISLFGKRKAVDNQDNGNGKTTREKPNTLQRHASSLPNGAHQ